MLNGSYYFHHRFSKIARIMDLSSMALVYLIFAKESEQVYIQASDTLPTDGLNKGSIRMKKTLALRIGCKSRSVQCMTSIFNHHQKCGQLCKIIQHSNMSFRK